MGVDARDLGRGPHGGGRGRMTPAQGRRGSLGDLRGRENHVVLWIRNDWSGGRRETPARTPKGEAHMEVYGAGGAQGPQPIYPRLAAFSVEAGSTVHAGAPRDHVEISPLGQMLDGISRLPEIRHEKVEEIRRQIASGSYEIPEKLELALDRMMDELMGW